MAAQDIISRARQENRSVLTEIEAKKILAEAGIQCTETHLAATREEAVALSERIGYPVVQIGRAHV